MSTITIERKPGKVYIGLDTAYFQEDKILKILERLRMEYLAEIIDFPEEIEELGEEIKANWWQKNKTRFIPESEL
jgi:uncharacterized protein YbaP (TraB family)